MKYYFIAIILAFILVGCSKGIYASCRPTGHLLNPFGSGCHTHSCLTKEGKQAISTPSRKGICTLTCEKKGKLGLNGGICNGTVYLPRDRL